MFGGFEHFVCLCVHVRVGSLVIDVNIGTTVILVIVKSSRFIQVRMNEKSGR